MNAVYERKESSPNIYKTAIARFGNSQGVRFSQDILKQAGLWTNLNELKGGRMPVELEVNPGVIIIRKCDDDEQEEWSQQKQEDIFTSVLKTVSAFSKEENDILPNGIDFQKENRAKWRGITE